MNTQQYDTSLRNRMNVTTKRWRFRVTIVVVAISSILLFGCTHKGDVRLNSDMSDRRVAYNDGSSVGTSINESGEKVVVANDSINTQFTNNDTIGMGIKLEKLKSDYNLQFDQEIELYSMPIKDQILLIEYLLKNNMPYPNTSHWGVSSVLKNRALNTARYESHFNRKAPDCQSVSDDVKFDSIGITKLSEDLGQPCLYYLDHLIRNALKNDLPILDDTIKVTMLDLWIADYMDYTGDTPLPAWFKDYSDDDKIIFLKYAFDRDCEISEGFPNPLYSIGNCYFSKEDADSIKIELEKVMVQYKKEHGREMPELEKAKIELQMQLDKPVHEFAVDLASSIDSEDEFNEHEYNRAFSNARMLVPTCEQCTDDELTTVLRHIIQMNTPWRHFFKTIDKDVARSLHKRKQERKLTATEMLIADLEIVYGRQIICPQCTDEELHMVWRHSIIDLWSKGILIPNVISDEQLRTIKEKGERWPPCRRD